MCINTDETVRLQVYVRHTVASAIAKDFNNEQLGFKQQGT